MEEKDLQEENVNNEATENVNSDEAQEVEITEEVIVEGESEEVIEEIQYVDEDGNPIEYAEEERTEEVILEVEETPEEKAAREALEREKEAKEKARKAQVDSYLESIFSKNYDDEEENKEIGVTVADESTAIDEDLFLDESEKKARNKKAKKENKKTEKKIKKKKEVLFDLDQSKKPVKEEAHEEKKEEEDEDKIDPNGLEIVVDRVEHGLIGSLRITDDINVPMFKKGDYAQLRAPSRLQKKDFILYKFEENYYLRRIIRFLDGNIYVAGDNEKAYHVVTKDDVVAKAIARQRGKKYYSFAFKSKPIYEFFKINLAKLRLGDRVMTADADMSVEAYEAAMAAVQETQVQQEKPKEQVINIDLDSDLKAFLDPDELVKELYAAHEQGAEVTEEPQEIYVDADGNPITEEEYNRLMAEAEQEALGEESADEAAEANEAEEVIEEETEE